MNWLPINPKHPFWVASTGSSLRLSSENNGLLITVHTMTQPYVYKLIDSSNSKKLYLKQKAAIKHIKTEWWDKYGNQTTVEFKEQKEDPDPCNFESCPPTPSPRSIRRSSLKTLLGSPRREILVPENTENSSAEDSSSEDKGSPRLLFHQASFQLENSFSNGMLPDTPPNSFNSELSPKMNEGN